MAEWGEVVLKHNRSGMEPRRRVLLPSISTHTAHTCFVRSDVNTKHTWWYHVHVTLLRIRGHIYVTHTHTPSFVAQPGNVLT